MAAFNYHHYNALTAGTAVAPQPGMLYGVTINSKGATANILTLYDGTSTSGTVIAVIDTTANVGTLFYKVEYLVGLYIAIATGTSADVTIITG